MAIVVCLTCLAAAALLILAVLLEDVAWLLGCAAWASAAWAVRTMWYWFVGDVDAG